MDRYTVSRICVEYRFAATRLSYFMTARMGTELIFNCSVENFDSIVKHNKILRFM